VVLDLKSGCAAAANAGHPPILWWNAAEQRLARVSRHGPILGVMSEWSAPTERWRLNPGDALMLYTDGVEDAKTGPEERLGEEALIRILGRTAPGSAQEWIERLRGALYQCREWPDDVTAVVIRYEPVTPLAPAAGRPGPAALSLPVRNGCSSGGDTVREQGVFREISWKGRDRTRDGVPRPRWHG
jgi:hypothetical protein